MEANTYRCQGLGSVLGFSRLCVLHCCLCFLLPFSFTVFSWEREHLCLALQLQVVDYMAVWGDRLSRNTWEL